MSPWHHPGRRENHEENDCLCAAHPHYNYDRCSRCNGTRRASGTNYMSSCATCNPPHTHNYSGRNCTYGGQCSCGASGTPLGHSYTGSTTYSDEDHPHAQYKFCARTNCWYKNYLGTNAVKNHGSGASGSGTCPDCGSCTSFTTPQYSDTHPHNGTKDCVDCGETHSAGTTTMSNCQTCNPHSHAHTLGPFDEAAHPHREYMQCTCTDKSYTGAQHNGWVTQSTSSSHPHTSAQSCSYSGCGTTRTLNTYPAYAGCATCFTGYDLDLEHYVDLAYVERFSNNGLPKTTIIQRTEAARDRFESILNLSLNYSNTVSDWISSADECKGVENGELTTNDYHSACSHSTNHQDSYNILNHATSSVGAGTRTSSKLFWTGHTLYDNDGDVIRSNSWNNASPGYYSVIMTPYAYVNLTTGATNSQSAMDSRARFEIMHELSHQFGAPDDPCNAPGLTPCSNVNCYYHVRKLETPPNCIMMYEKDPGSSISNQNICCEFCLDWMRAHLNNHH